MVMVAALAKKMAKPETKTVTRTIAIPKTKIVKQPVQKTTNQTATKDTDRNITKPVAPKKTVMQSTSQPISVWKPYNNAWFYAVYSSG